MNCSSIFQPYENNDIFLRSLFICMVLWVSTIASADMVSFTIDDPEVGNSPFFLPLERNEKILNAFEKNHIAGALFVCGMRIDNPLGKELLQSWDLQGHLIGNHTYSHLYFNSDQLTFEDFRDDFIKVEPLITHLKNFYPLLRFPYLKEGNTKEKRDLMRREIKQKNYRHGYVSIDSSDWYVDDRMRERLVKNPHVDLKPYRDYYLQHIWDRAVFYNELAQKVFKRKIKHTLLLHHNLLNALFLNDLMQMFEIKGWKLISAREAYEDPIYQSEPNIVPAGESIIWASAKETGKFDDQLRYPAEDGEYQKEEMDKLGL